MTDQDMDARLRAAGENWRIANTVVADHSDVDEIERVAVQPSPPHRRRHWLTTLSAAVVAAALVIGAVFAFRHEENSNSSALPATAQRLNNVTWTETSTPIQVVFMNGAVRIYDGCSEGTYSLTVTASQLTIGRANGPVSACVGTPRVPGQADANQVRVAKFHRVVSGTVSWSVTGSTLTLTKPGVGTVVLTTDSSPALAVIGTTWQLSQITDAKGETLSKVDTAATLVVSDEARLQASDQCNDLTARAVPRLSDIAIGDVTTTERACIDPVLSRGARTIDQVLSGTVHYEIRGPQLILSKPGSAAIVVYMARSSSTTGSGQLVGPSWKLSGTEVETTSGSGGSASGNSAISLSVLTLTKGGTFTVRHRCYTDEGRVTLSGDTATLADVRLKTAIPCASGAESPAGQRENDFVDALLTGTVTWKIDSGHLSIIKSAHTADFTHTR